MIGQRREPAMPEQVAVMDKHPIPAGGRANVVRAKRIAVEPAVAMASERRNQASRKMRSWRNESAMARLRHREVQAKARYSRDVPRREAERDVFLVRCEGKGGPGRLRRRNEVGIVRIAQNNPVRKSMKRRGSVRDAVILEANSRTVMARNWTRTAVR
jgi:hypothetical protein